MMEDPQTSCGCFECIVAINSDLQGVIIVNREYTGMTPIGMKVLNARRVCRWGQSNAWIHWRRQAVHYE